MTRVKNLFVIFLVILEMFFLKENKLQAGVLALLKPNVSNNDSMIKQKLPEDVTIQTDPNNQTPIFLKADNLSVLIENDISFKNLVLSKKFGEAAIYFLETNRSLFKLINPEKEFVIKSLENDDIGYKHIRFNQVFSNISIWGSELIVHFNKDNHIYLVNGRYIPTPAELITIPVLSVQEIKKIVAEEYPRIESRCNECKIKLVIFNDPINKTYLAYQVLVSISLAEKWEIIVDANTGSVLQKMPIVYN
jgi:Zn-dependent metalloprotease